jgi:hypothetical protein
MEVDGAAQKERPNAQTRNFDRKNNIRKQGLLRTP